MDYIYQEHVVDLLEHVLGLLLRYRPSRPVSFVQEWLMLSGRPEPTEEHFGQRCCIYSHPSGIILCSQCNWTHDGCDDRKQYVQQKAVRGLLDAVIGALLQNQPDEPAFFLQEWLSTFSPRSQSHKSKTEAAVMSMMNQGYEEDESCTNSDINLEDQTPGEMEDQDKRNKHIWAWLGQISLPSLSTNSESASQDTRTISEVGSIVLSVAESSNTPPASPCGPTFFTTTSTRSNRSDRSSFSSSSQMSRSTRSKRSCLARREFVGRSTETRNVKFNV